VNDGDPVLVTVCGALSLLVQVTFVPAATVRLPGENAIPWIFTELGLGGVPEEPVGELSLEQDTSIRPATIIPAARKITDCLRDISLISIT